MKMAEPRRGACSEEQRPSVSSAVGLSDKPAGALAPLNTTEVKGPRPGTLKATRAEVATFSIECVDKGEWIHRAPIIWNSKK
jgi:hypothetical protein